MRVRRLALQQFRNYGDTGIDLDPGLNVFVGGNGEGKTNLLEAVYTAVLGRSPRVLRDSDLVQHGQSRARVRLEIEHGQRGEGSLDWQLTIADGVRRTRGVNGKAAAGSDFAGWLRVVMFGPDDLQLIKGSGEARRRLMNVALAQAVPAYAARLNRVQRALEQRNRLLRMVRAGESPESALDEWDLVLTDEGAWLMAERERWITRLAEPSRAAYAELSQGRERLSIGYLPGHGIEEVSAGALARRLRESRPDDIQRGQTQLGPHRDDLGLLLDGRPARSFASQGQQRSVAIAVKIAERRVQEEDAREAPVLLLDDVLSELDPSRQAGLLSALAGDGQALVTTSQEAEARDFTATRGTTFRVVAGTVAAGKAVTG
ncbi:MAG: DNA replication/repair protein RecF [Candidatus Dormibacteria bacterium]